MVDELKAWDPQCAHCPARFSTRWEKAEHEAKCSKRPAPTQEMREAVLERICIGLFADLDNLSLESAERNWRNGYAYGAVGSDGHTEVLRAANLIADSLALLNTPCGEDGR